MHSINNLINNKEKGDRVDPVSAKLLGIVMTPIIGISAWIGKRIHNRLDYHDKQIQELKISEAVQETRFKEIDKKLDKIIDKLDG